MSELQEYVDFLFKKYKHWPTISDLKEEILGNLEDKVAHLKKQGWEEQAAIEEAKRSIKNVDALIDGNVSVHLNTFRFQAFQWAFLYLIIAWIASTPITMIRMASGLHFFLLLICLAMGIVYMLFAKKRHDHKIGQINAKAMQKAEKIIWMLWGLYILVMSGYTAAVQFGSNMWFSRPVVINGPYQLGILISQFVLPFFSIIVPLTFHTWKKLVFLRK